MPEFRLPSKTSRQQAFELWKHSFMPMVTLTKTFDVSSLAEQPHFNARFVWAIARAASRSRSFTCCRVRRAFCCMTGWLSM